MFDRALYDRTLYDRTQGDFQNITAFIQGSGDLNVDIVVQVFLIPFVLTGNGRLESTPLAYQDIRASIAGEGKLLISDLHLLDAFSGSLSGEGNAEFEIIAKTPIDDLLFDGLGELSESTLFFFQHMQTNLNGRGDLHLNLVLKMPIAVMPMFGDGEMIVDDQVSLWMPMKGSVSGFGEITFRRIGALNTDVLAFTGLNLRPGQTMIIDTEELNVFIDNILNVNSVTEDSVFFQLKPGEDSISFSTDSGVFNLTVTVVWQNRWL